MKYIIIILLAAFIVVCGADTITTTRIKIVSVNHIRKTVDFIYAASEDADVFEELSGNVGAVYNITIEKIGWDMWITKAKRNGK